MTQPAPADARYSVGDTTWAGETPGQRRRLSSIWRGRTRPLRATPAAAGGSAVRARLRDRLFPTVVTTRGRPRARPAARRRRHSFPGRNRRPSSTTSGPGAAVRRAERHATGGVEETARDDRIVRRYVKIRALHPPRRRGGI